MKHIYIYLILLNLLTINFAFSQGANCASSAAFCAGGSTLTFPNSTGTTAEAGIDYECLASQPNPAWFFMQIGSAGTIDFEISQISNGGNPIDVDYIIWGPFPGPIDTTQPFPYCGPTFLNPTTSGSCSYSPAAVEDFGILNAVVGDVYVVLLTNFSGQAGNITVTQTNAGQPGAGGTDCNIVCQLSVAPQVICPGAQAILTATIENATSYQWSSVPGGPIPGNTQSITVTQPGTYTVIVNKPGCVANATASTTVSFSTPPPINLPVNLTQCSNLP
ncbi:PKD domain-containing protein, partial [Flavobacterium sp.]|uniref:PKD domain-containing protein n=1 Tax=Flavobacterium sp. TaxID=239 RepID=UPI00391A2BC2